MSTIASLRFRLVIGLLLCAGWPAGAFAAPAPVKAAVIRSTGTMYLGQTIWPDLNSGWASFGTVPVQIDYTSLAGYGLTLSKIESTGADVLILSAAGYMTYQDSEISAINDYVRAGHGIIITYHSFQWNLSRLAPLVGLTESIKLGTAYFADGIEFTHGDHFIFSGINGNYRTGADVMALPVADGLTWTVGQGSIIADAFAVSGLLSHGVIVAEDPGPWRGLYFSHYIEDKADGSNHDDMQVFYNGLLWVGGAPEPASCLLLLTGFSLLLRRKRRS